MDAAFGGGLYVHTASSAAILRVAIPAQASIRLPLLLENGLHSSTKACRPIRQHRNPSRPDARRDHVER